MRRPSLALLALALAAPTLCGCLTPKAKPTPSQAVVEARKGLGAKPAACQLGDLASVSPVTATFPFDEAKIDEEGLQRLTRAAAWLNCNAGVPAVIVPTADKHGTAEHMNELAVQRAQAALAALREAGAANAVVHTLAPGAPDTITTPHLVIQADGRGW